jgi:chromatin segregation and condensation protein Rec8/ScpA/Scc1 (kleisin family)
MNAEEKKEYMKEWHQTHKEEEKEYRRKHPEHDKNYRETHKERERERHKKYSLTHKEQARIWRKQHWKEQLQKRKERYHNDPEFRKSIIDLAKKIKKNLLEKRKAEIFKLLGNKCSNPFGIDHTAFEQISDYFFCLQIDHVNGNGHKDIGSKCRTTYYRYVLEQIKNGSKSYQLLCPTCNWIKKRRNKEL